MKEKTIYVVGQYVSGDFPDTIWHFQGVFESESDAVLACVNYKYFIGPTSINKEFPENYHKWEGLYYPIQKDIEENEE